MLMVQGRKTCVQTFCKW